ncbi:polyadenylate-binding protein-interacting protein 1 [Corythoichthys intestinalis]|uniref:polyadenylate-binding protein-interacting protein 1 n=1 Tax=Corythoichthys intestinalis TaxID=161448 RepID=UPI0025A64ED7|nr:polyadenylate-binding protein-interacting protein 1 [Corythoichthys intestinalis]XP_061811566.1 polyadenylate-binding protein-interacting protein 1-like [Nerophis lumbriciformis]
MNDNFNRAPGAGRSRNLPVDAALQSTVWDSDSRFTDFNQREPLRQPRTYPANGDFNISSATENGATSGDSGDSKRQSVDQHSVNANSPSRACNHLDSLVESSKLSASAPEFVPNAMYQNDVQTYYEDNDDTFSAPSLAEMVRDFLCHLSSSPGMFESDVEHITSELNSYVTTVELLAELVDLIYTESTAIPNFAYTGARLCNYLSHHLNLSPSSGNFRQLLLLRCQKEFEQRDVAVQGDRDTQKKFHAFVLFLGELYLHLELKSGKGALTRAHILLHALKELLDSLLSSPVDANIICAVKLLKLTGSALDDAWKESGNTFMEELIQRIETIVLDATCSREVRQMLLKLVELRSSDWGRVCTAAASNATPDNDPNYFMNEPTFYTEDGTPFTAADPEYAEKYQEIMERQDYFHEFGAENETENDEYDFDDEMDPEIEEAYENFCLESERKRQQ